MLHGVLLCRRLFLLLLCAAYIEARMPGGHVRQTELNFDRHWYITVNPPPRIVQSLKAGLRGRESAYGYSLCHRY